MVCATISPPPLITLPDNCLHLALPSPCCDGGDDLIHHVRIIIKHAAKMFASGEMNPSLTDELRLAAVDGPQERLQLVRAHKDVVIGPDEPLELVDKVLVHVVQHHEGLFLRRVPVVHPLQADHRHPVCWGALGTEEGDPPRHRLAPRLVNCLGAVLQKVFGCHDTDQHQIVGRIVRQLVCLQINKFHRRDCGQWERES